MNKLMTLSDMGFNVSWELIYIGLHGYEEIPALLGHDDIKEYLVSIIGKIEEETDCMIELICEDDSVKFEKIIKKCISNENSINVIQKRKWRVYLLSELLDHISDDYLPGLLALMEFWVSMRTPNDCPQVFPDNSSNKSIQEYFTQSSYEFNLCENRKWLHKEINAIIAIDSYGFDQKHREL